MDQKRNRGEDYIRPTHADPRLPLAQADGTATDYLGRDQMSISEGLLEKEDLRSRLFGETWRTLIPEVFRDVPTYYDKGNAVASLGTCACWSGIFAQAGHRHLP